MLVPDEFTCPFCAAQQLHARNTAAKDEKLPKPQSGKRHPLDGVSRFLRPARPDEIERHQERKKEVEHG